MSRPSSIDKLPPEIRAEINRLRTDSKWTLDEVLAYLQKAGHDDISRSALGRHAKKLEEVTRRIQDARAIAEGVAPTLAAKDDGQLLNLNVELLQGGLMRLLSAGDGEDDVPLKPSEAAAIGKALEASAKASKITAERVLKVQQEAAKQAAEKVIDGVQAELEKNNQPGLSKKAIDNLWEAIGVTRK